MIIFNFFLDYVQPICLPVYNIFLGSASKFVVAGWGKTKDSPSSNVKIKALVPYVNSGDCQQIYSNRWLRDDQICAGGERGVDTCRGDSGGPLMYYQDRKWIVYGVVSIGPRICGQENRPALYTKVEVYREWIFRKIAG